MDANPSRQDTVQSRSTPARFGARVTDNDKGNLHRMWIITNSYERFLQLVIAASTQEPSASSLWKCSFKIAKESFLSD